MTVTGERTFSTSGRTVVSKDFPLLPNGLYGGAILGSDITIGRSDKPGSVPYINFSVEAKDTAATEGGKNQRVFHRLFLSVLPGRDGTLNTDRDGGITDLAKGLGTDLDDVKIIDEQVTVDGEEKTLSYLNPKEVVEWLKAQVGIPLTMRVKTEKGTNGYKDKNVIAKFSPAS